MPSFRAAYLIHGDDHGRIAERRARLRAMAEDAAGSAGVEVYEAEACTPENVAAALSTMTFALGRRFVIADGVERWKDSDVEPVAQALHSADPETLTVAFFAREEGRYKVPAKLVEAVEKAGGQIAAELNVKSWDLPKWLIEQAKHARPRPSTRTARRPSWRRSATASSGCSESSRSSRSSTGRALTSAPTRCDESCATSAERKVWTLADALVAGDRRTSIELLIELREQGERVTGLTYNMVRRLRDAVAVAEQLQAGQSAAQVKKTLRMPPRAADKFVKDVAARDVDESPAGARRDGRPRGREPRRRRRRPQRGHRRRFGRS